MLSSFKFKNKNSFFIWFRSLTISLSFLVSGYNISSMNAFAQKYENLFQWTSNNQINTGLALLCFAFGFSAIFGCLLSIWLLSRIGRFWTLLMINLISSIGLILSIFANLATLYIGRCLLGLSFGISLSTIPLYIYETSPFEKRWQLGSLSGICFGCGIFLCFICGMARMNDNTNNACWRFISICPIIFNIIQLIMVPFFVLESPYYYAIAKGDADNARRIIKTIHEDAFGDNYSESAVTIETQCILKVLVAATFGHMYAQIRVFDLTYMNSFIIVITGVYEALGISVILMYSNRILLFHQPNLGFYKARIWTLGIGICFLIGTFIFPLTFKKPRFLLKPWLLLGILMISLLDIAIGVFFNLKIYLICWIGFLIHSLLFSTTINILTYLTISDIMPLIGMSLSMCLKSLIMLIITFPFLWIQESVFTAALPFYFFAGFSLFAAIHIQRKLPNTKGMPLCAILSMYDRYPNQKPIDGIVSLPTITSSNGGGSGRGYPTIFDVDYKHEEGDNNQIFGTKFLSRV